VSATALSTADHPHVTALTLNDQCDRCGSQALVYVRLTSGGELLFCGHHAHQYGPELGKIAEIVSDQTARLVG